MGLFDKIMGGLFGSSGGGAQIDWGQLERIMDLQSRLNRFNDVGIFGGTKWQEGADGQWTRTQEVHPGLQEGIAGLMARASSPMDPSQYQSRIPDQFSSLMDAKMANQMQRHGILDPNEQNPSWSLRQSELPLRYGHQDPNRQEPRQQPQPTEEQRTPFGQIANRMPQRPTPMPPDWEGAYPMPPGWGGGGGGNFFPNRPK